jgi:orotate phosphoribosyltransferase
MKGLTMKEIRERLIRLFRRNSLLFGRFTLTSGLTSHYYFDGKLTTLDAEGAYLCAKLILEVLKREGIEADAIGGLTLGADPVVAAVAAVSYAEKDLYRPLPAFIVRKEPKKHGTQRYIEGLKDESGARVIIVDDVCTTGDSTMKAIVRAQEAGLEVVATIALVDRQQGGAELLRGFRFVPLLTAAELLDDPEIQEKIGAAAAER